MPSSFAETGRIVDPLNREVFSGTVHVRGGRIDRIERHATDAERVILPGFVDAHVHVESSMLTPSEFARAAVQHGTVATVSDPHEIANVLGIDGVTYMIEDGQRVPFKFNFGAPSCVPATPFETAGATLDPDDVAALLDRPAVRYLSEVMNYPGVLSGDPDMRAKIDAAQQRGLPRDGHAPGLRGADAQRYADAGICTDHECVTIDEARDKLAAGMHILIREGSAAKNFDALIPLMDEAPERLMFCTDDAHPDALLRGHIDALVRRAIDRGYDRMDVLRAACVHPVQHYGLDVGLLQEGDPADFVVADTLDALNVVRTYVDGALVAEDGATRIDRLESPVVNAFAAQPKQPGDFACPAEGDRIRVIEAEEGQLVTRVSVEAAHVVDGRAVSHPERDVLKLTVVNRYQDAEPAIGFIRGFGLERGAIASSVAHDSHNIIAVGTSDAGLCRAVNQIIEHRGGIGAVDEDDVLALPLPIAGLISDQPYDAVARRYIRLNTFAQQRLGSAMDAPFMTLSFMALLVIPQLKLSDKGLFDGGAFQFVDLFVNGG
ncbi:MAG: adenine deaminase [Bacteroidetes bacterium]|jgi:adenine deaminase|nr:adenine deaminase [Bacteroidota bacterium]